jgi:2-iminoacetate synthase
MNKVLSKNGINFIQEAKLHKLIEQTRPDDGRVREVIAKSLSKQPLQLEETAALLKAEQPHLVEEIFAAARQLKKDVYGNRIVLFAPLYIGSYCVNDCSYCSFRRSNKEAFRRTLTPQEIVQQVEALESKGHKRLILVFGEHPTYNADFIADTVTRVYGVKKGHGEIRRVNINAAPMDIEGYRKVKEAGIGTYQIFMETYHQETYERMHPLNTEKGDFLWRLDGLNRAFEAGCDDVGIGALFGLYDWRFDVLGLVAHSLFLQDRYAVGPHTISFPRLQPANGVDIKEEHLVSDYDFKRLVAILRLSVPYTGMILTARENARLRKEVMAFGVSQIDAGSRIEIGGYTEIGDAQVQISNREQFTLGDLRSIDEVMRQLLGDGYLPSFCTACYRLGRTGEHFMEFAIPGFIEKFCTPNGILTLMEYLTDYASEDTRRVGEQLILKELDKIENPQLKEKVTARLDQIKSSDDRDFYF